MACDKHAITINIDFGMRLMHLKRFAHTETGRQAGSMALSLQNFWKWTFKNRLRLIETDITKKNQYLKNESTSY